MTAPLTEKQTQFNAAMARYERHWVFRRTKDAVAVVVVGLQATMLVFLSSLPIGPVEHAAVLVSAYALADFVNGWVHLYMDNSENYASTMGPFFASFHLHHRTPKYRRRPLIVVYCAEAGSKLWLAGAEIPITAAIWFGFVPPWLAYLMFYFAVLSCVAEVSHYLCHVPQTQLTRWLGRLRLIMPARYHARHHREDNVQYAFLNGMSDPVLDWIARRWYPGYKTTTDTHYAHYSGGDTSNRDAE